MYVLFPAFFGSDLGTVLDDSVDEVFFGVDDLLADRVLPLVEDVLYGVEDRGEWRREEGVHSHVAEPPSDGLCLVHAVVVHEDEGVVSEVGVLLFHDGHQLAKLREEGYVVVVAFSDLVGDQMLVVHCGYHGNVDARTRGAHRSHDRLSSQRPAATAPTHAAHEASLVDTHHAPFLDLEEVQQRQHALRADGLDALRVPLLRALDGGGPARLVPVSVG